jgi:hypothetical protein
MPMASGRLACQEGVRREHQAAVWERPWRGYDGSLSGFFGYLGGIFDYLERCFDYVERISTT